MSDRRINEKPNILCIVPDQQRADWLGYAGADWCHTPNIDRLVARGTVFTNCFSNSPICGPARSALATGQRPHRLGILDHTLDTPLSATTFYERLRDHGYWTGLIGKLDIEKPSHTYRPGPEDERSPLNAAYGFCESRRVHTWSMGPPPDGPDCTHLKKVAEAGYFEAYCQDRAWRAKRKWTVGCNMDSALPEALHVETAIGDAAVDFLENTPTNFPWFLQVGFDGPHDPFDPPPEYGRKYRGAAVPDPIPADLRGKSHWARHRFCTDDVADIRQARRQYAAQIEHIDAQIGRLIGALEHGGELERTVIVFTSDHGEMLGDFGLYQKQVPYEPSVRVPLVMAGPGVPVGRRSDALAEWIDLNPTLCELAGLPPQNQIDASSLGPVLRGEATAHRDHVLITLRPYRALRTRSHKFIDNTSDDPELYDLEADPLEQQNLLAPESGTAAPEATELAARMRHQLAESLNEGRWLR